MQNKNNIEDIMIAKKISASIAICVLVIFCAAGANAVTTAPLSGAAIKSAPTAADVVLGTDTSTGQTRNFQLGKLSAVLDWSAWPNGSSFAANMMVAYQGQIYKCLQPYTKNSGDTPAAFTAYWSATGGGVTSYTALTDKPTIPASLADLSADSTHRVVTDAEKTTWSGKESALGAPATSDWCLKSNTSGVRAWGACGSFDVSGSYSPTGTWDFTGATLAGVPKTSDFVTFSASSPLSFNPSTGALSMVTHAYQAYDANMIAWPVAVSATEISYLDGATSNLQTQINAISAGGFVPTYVTTDPTTASTAGLYINTTSGHMFVVGAPGMLDVAGTWTAATSGGHNWVTDTTLQALYLLDGSSEDAKNGQTLLCVNAPSCPTSDTTNKVEGPASISFTQSGTDLSYYIPQASLVTTFPANGPGDSAITVGGWIRTTTISADNKMAWNIHNGNTSNQIFGLDITSDNHLTLTADASGISTVNSDTSLDNLSWYFHAATYDGTNTCLYVRKLGATTGSYTCITGATGGLDDMTTTGYFAVGGRYNGETSAAMFGNLDAIAVFTRAFNQTELDAVFAYGWEGAGW